MDKNAIKKYAVWARRELISRVSHKALQYGISEKNIMPADADSVNGRLLSSAEKSQRRALIERIKRKGYNQVMEEAAYTWFNRFSALRFMEVNGYLPTRVRVFTDEENNFKPQILAEAIYMEMPGLDRDKVYELKDTDKTEELYKYLLITQCNALSGILPGMFEKISDYTELLLPDNLLREGSVIEQMISMIPEEDWKDQVQIIGWLYQYYNTEPKDNVFADLRKNIKITKERIPAATQLFTPAWIVCYMVENSLGRIFIDKWKNEGVSAGGRDREEATFEETEKKRIADEKRLAEQMGWKYYLPEAEQTPEVRKQLDENRRKYADPDVKDIKIIDPCMGSGHILVYAFDVLMQIYEKSGYSRRDAAQSILKNNLYGLDIDDRAAQLAYFAVMMKARRYDRSIFSRGIQPHLYAIPESNGLDRGAVDYFINNDPEIKKDFGILTDELRDAKEYGSILNISEVNFAALYDRIDVVHDDISIYRDVVLNTILPLIQAAEVMAMKYDVVVTNPPYMGSSGMGGKLNEFVKRKYPDSKSDLFAVFIERCAEMTSLSGYQAMITMHSWMFLSSFEKLRTKLMTKDIMNMAHLGARAFEEIGGEVVQTTSFVLRKRHISGYKGTYCRLIEPTTQQGKEDMFLSGENRYIAKQDNFSKIPGAPIAYWVTTSCFDAFKYGISLERLAQPRQGLATGCNDIFIRLWYEVDILKTLLSAPSYEAAISADFKWRPYNKGGNFRKWYGNNDFIVNWENDGYEIRNFVDRSGKLRSRPQNINTYFKESITWSKISSGSIAFRYKPTGHIYDVAGTSIFTNYDTLLYLAGFCNSCVALLIANILSPTINYEVGHIANFPIIFRDEKKDKVKSIVENNISLSKSDWDSFETSWDFKQHPLVQNRVMTGWGDDGPLSGSISQSFDMWREISEYRFNTLKSNEEELNRIFIDIYGLQDELTPDVDEKDVTVRKADLERDIRSLISYAVGCMFGRYSLDVEGLVYAGGEWDEKYCRWASFFNDDDKLNEALTEKGELIDGGWAGSSLWKYDGVRVDGKWKKATFEPDTDNIIPICDDNYFEDDITALFVKWVETVYGKDTLEENLRFIADALGGKGSPREVIRGYFINGFYADHCKIYQKRPIYWLFDSGKNNGFKALIYMHRYRKDLLARMRTDYVHEQQERYRTAVDDLNRRIGGASGSDAVRLRKQLQKILAQETEIRAYEEKIHHLADQMISIDLDDGVKVNYAKFQDVLAKIK
ncbi:MAG: BREX-1 system adenine-specific DNA-methyltransferase PglX [Clostridiales bacterium]|nr:BREX-1 system adenine-specific DNA-methyltransferase PglX [Clostridiales bacterium]